MDQVTDSEHQLFLVEGRLLCTECQQSVTVSSTGNAVAWAKTRCCKVMGNALRDDDIVHVGRQVTHHTHKLYYHRKVLFCLKCGSYTSYRHLLNLAKPCGPLTAYGQACLESLKRNMLPPGLTAWPAESGPQNSVGPAGYGRGSLLQMFASNSRLESIRQRILAKSRL